MKRLFRTTSDADAERCKEASKFGKQITVRGVNSVTGKLTEYVGHILSVSYSSGRPWEIGIDTD